MSNGAKILLRCLGYCGFAAVLVWLFVHPRSPHHTSFEVQRASQRKLSQERVQGLGGWAVLAADCRKLVADSKTDYFQWVSIHDSSENDGKLPSSITALKPHEVMFEVSTNAPTVVRIKLFGMHRTGGWDVPYYGLWVVCGGARPDYVPPITEGPARSVAKITNEIFEAYH
jgi:hypothetical protein